MAMLFTGKVELSETPTPNHPALFIGTTLSFRFQVKRCTADVSAGRFPAVRIRTSGVNTFQEWQQHEVRLNGVLVGTIDRASSGDGGDSSTVFEFPFQPRVLRVQDGDPWELPLEKVNVLTISLGAGGFGLEDSFNVSEVEMTEVLTNIS